MNKAAYVKKQAKDKNHRNHKCHAKGCDTQVHPAYFMCPKHWRMVPRSMRTDIWTTFAPGQERGEADVSDEYSENARKAIDYVFEKEKESA